MARAPRRTPAARARARTRTTTKKSEISPEWRGALIAGGILLAIVVAYNVGNDNLTSSASPPRTPAAVAASAYEALGPVPAGSRLRRHTVVPGPGQFVCPDGTLGKHVKSRRADGMTHDRWACPKSF